MNDTPIYQQPPNKPKQASIVGYANDTATEAEIIDALGVDPERVVLLKLIKSRAGINRFVLVTI